MKALIRCAEARALDVSTLSSWSLPEGALMESAAQRLWLALAELLGTRNARRAERIVFVAGSGNNGGDALALARHASFAGCSLITAIVPGPELRGLVARQAASLAAGGVPLLRAGTPEALQAIAEAGFIVDGIAGTGLSGSLRGEARQLVAAINAAAARVVSIDLPSGFRDDAGADDPVIEADWTLSIAPTKSCLYLPAFRSSSGSILELEDIFPADAGSASPSRLLEPDEYLQARAGDALLDSHKGQRGRVGVLAGSPGMAGAALLAVRAAQAAGAGLVTLYACPELFAALGAGQAGEALGGAIVKPESSLRDDGSRLDSMLAGPGWVQSEGHGSLLSWLLESGLPLVLDAGALTMLAAAGEAAALPRALQGRRAPLILTPHPGELSTLSGLAIPQLLANPEPTLRAVCERFDATVILKSSTSWMMSPGGDIRVLDGREPALGVAGSGDVLSGLTAGLLARDSAVKNQFGLTSTIDLLARAACLHLLAGRQARADSGWFDAFALVPVLARLCGNPRA